MGPTTRDNGSARMMFKTPKYVAGLLIVWGTLLVAVSVPSASASSWCGSNYCSGSDSSTGTNAQGNQPQEYVGEVGVYYWDAGGSGSKCAISGHDWDCFNTTAASEAQLKWLTDNSMGVQSYYFSGGANSSLEGKYGSPYCFGWFQGYEADYGAYDYYGAYYLSQYIMAMDIEQNSNTGWNGTAAADRSVFNGFYDFLTGAASKDSHCTYGTPPELQQPAVYASPGNFTTAFGSGGSAYMPNTYMWTTEQCCSASWPGTFTGGAGASFFPASGSGYNWGWQFDENPDYDMFYAPDYLPALGHWIGT